MRAQASRNGSEAASVSFFLTRGGSIADGILSQRPSYQRQLAALEAYRKRLLSALQKCAIGQWGLLGDNEEAARQLGARARSRRRDLCRQRVEHYLQHF